VRRLPLGTLLLCAAMAAVYLLSAAAQGGTSLTPDTLLRFGALPLPLLPGPPGTGIGGDGPLSALSGGAVGRVLRLLSGPFVHADPPHLLGNLAALLVGGALTERRLGRRRAVLLFFFGAVSGELCAAAAQGVVAPARAALALGASGGALALLARSLFLRVAAPLRALAGLCALALLLSGLFLHGDSAAHLGGLGAGLLWAIVPAKRGGSHGR
jgi:membrane associated rhomboid family serine protease